MEIKLYNTLGREKQEFKPIQPTKAGMYTCGPTVYNYQHIGNFRTFLFEDFLKRVLLYNGYDVTQIMNITDVGHLVSDSDEGDDKMEKGAAREGKTVWEIADYYTGFFYDDAKLLNILPADKYTKATDYIPEQIDMVKCLEEKGFTYITGDGVYFDTGKFPDYGKMAKLDIEGLEEGIRIEASKEKKNKTDFALWKFSPKDSKRQMEWDSPWGKGFPGWHLECSAMSKKFLGDTFDIHCGGIDHIPIHHTNEIAQSESCNGKKFVNYWLHGAFLEEQGGNGNGKMSKSKGEFLRLKLLVDKGYSPMDYRYLCLGTHYRKRLIFSWELLDSAKSAHSRLRNKIKELKGLLNSSDSPAPPERSRAESDNVQAESPGTKQRNSTVSAESPKGDSALKYKQRFLESVNDDLNMPEGLAVLWDTLREETLSPKDKLELLYDFDKVLGLNLSQADEEKAEVPADVMELVNQRIVAKKAKDYKLADELRLKITGMGYDVVDKKDGTEVKKI